MRTSVRIVAGSLRGRRVSFTVGKHLRPAPQMVREALFSILGDAVPDRAFIDLFAGTGAVGLEALSRGARSVTFVEKDARVAQELDKHVREFGVRDRAHVTRMDVYRWPERWPGFGQPVNIFLGPPFPDLQDRLTELVTLVSALQALVAPGSVLVLQMEHPAPVTRLPDNTHWDVRRYGRNIVAIWEKSAATD